MAKGTKATLAPTVKPFAAPTSSTQKIFAANKSGATPRDVPRVDGFTRGQIENGRALGRDLSPGDKLETGERSTAGGTKAGA